MELNSPLHKVWTAQRDFLPKNAVWIGRRGKSTFTVEKPNTLNTLPSQVGDSKININSNKSDRWYDSLTWYENLPLWPSFQKSKPKSKHEEDIRQIPVGGNFTKYQYSVKFSRSKVKSKLSQLKGI